MLKNVKGGQQKGSTSPIHRFRRVAEPLKTKPELSPEFEMQSDPRDARVQ